ncbi:MAG: sulfide/dihydroorotate dehydrogenase-like FAD/NAD-binding protein [Clostridia bacterium]|nr:sulfide/dihydroorotate dehydrogenase-like FAD/NAD-binding protein [Clostridia bacterium]
MYRIVKKDILNESVHRISVYAPEVARAAQPGQFVILRVNENGERIPLTVNDADPAEGTVTVIFQLVGMSTRLLGLKEAGDSLQDFVGPLGNPSELEGLTRVCVVGGGVGCAIAYPQAKALHRAGAHVDVIAGFRTSGLVILEEEMRAVAEYFTVATDDGSNGNKGFVTDLLRARIDAMAAAGEPPYERILAIGPLPMMRAVANLTRGYGIKTVVSMNTVMIDGTGMCGGCRLTVGGKTVFACVDGPDFDAHEVDFDEAMRRGSFYRSQERASEENCRLLQGGR